MNEKLTIPTIAEMNAPEFHMKLCENDDKTWERLRLAIQTNYFVKASWRDKLQKCGLNIEDVAQEIVKKLLKSNTYNPEQGSKFTSWLHTVVSTRLNDLYKQREKQNNGGNIISLDDNSVADSGKDTQCVRDIVPDPHDIGETLEKRDFLDFLTFISKEGFTKVWNKNKKQGIALLLSLDRDSQYISKLLGVDVYNYYNLVSKARETLRDISKHKGFTPPKKRRRSRSALKDVSKHKGFTR